MGKPAYQAQTVDGMRSIVLENAKTALEVVQTKTEREAKHVMVRKIRNGLSIKIGYGAKNETLCVFGQDENGNDEVEQRYLDSEREKAITYLRDSIVAIEDGILDGALSDKLEDFRKRANLGKLARANKKAQGVIVSTNIEPLRNTG